jgi:hypothetical protein
VRPPRRHGDALIMGWKHRRHILRHVTSKEEMRTAILEVEEIRKQREQTFIHMRLEIFTQTLKMMRQKPQWSRYSYV